jgi:hypothetical protein
MSDELDVEPYDVNLPTGSMTSQAYEQWHGCGHAYYLRYVKKVRIPMRAEAAMHQAVHHIAQLSNSATIAARGGAAIDGRTVLPEAEAEFRRHQREHAQSYDPEWNAAWLRATHFGIAYVTKVLPKLRPVTVEMPFHVRKEGVVLKGTVDYVDSPPIPGVPVEAGDVVLVDLRLSKVKIAQGAVDGHVGLGMASIALSVPTLRVDNLIAKDAAQVVRYEATTTRRTVQERENLLESLAETTELIGRGVFPKAVTNSWRCRPEACDYWSQCRGKRS